MVDLIVNLMIEHDIMAYFIQETYLVGNKETLVRGHMIF